MVGMLLLPFLMWQWRTPLAGTAASPVVVAGAPRR
jgi:hypothetical protein